MVVTAMLVFSQAASAATHLGLTEDPGTISSGTTGNYDIQQPTAQAQGSASLDKEFLHPTVLKFVVHASHQPEGLDLPFDFSEDITNSTFASFVRFEFHIDANDPRVHFVDPESKAALSGFRLMRGLSDTTLEFIGRLDRGEQSSASFIINIPDPGVGRKYDFLIVELPSPGSATVPEPTSLVVHPASRMRLF